MRILLAEKADSPAGSLQALLEQHKYAVDRVVQSSDVLEYGRSGAYDGILMDTALPDAAQMLEKLRQEGVTTPVLLMAADSSLEERVAGLDAGADDYITRPWAVTEFLARVRALLRRRETYISDVIRLGNLSLNCASFTLSTPQNSLRLNNKEFQLLACLMRHPGRLFPIRELMERIWGWDSPVQTCVVWTNVNSLRRKLERLRATVQIQTLRGVGYRICEQE